MTSAIDRAMTETIPFLKMHGLGNDFVVLDARSAPIAVTPALVRAMADRHRGVGFDQLATMEQSSLADVLLTFYNADGSISGACGNATRCVGRFLMEETQKDVLTLQTASGVLHAVDAGKGLTSVNMGYAATDWSEIPLAEPMDTLQLPLDGGPTATSMGNPHCSFFVEDAEAVDLVKRGSAIETNPLFPERTNVQFVSMLGTDHLRMRVWERGTGVTLASGSSSCAVAHAAHRRGLVGHDVRITLDGGEIAISIRDDGIWMTGPTAYVFDGVWRGALV